MAGDPGKFPRRAKAGDASLSEDDDGFDPDIKPRGQRVFTDKKRYRRSGNSEDD